MTDTEWKRRKIDWPQNNTTTKENLLANNETKANYVYKPTHTHIFLGFYMCVTQSKKVCRKKTTANADKVQFNKNEKKRKL